MKFPHCETTKCKNTLSYFVCFGFLGSKQEIIEMNSTTSGHSSTDHCVQELIAKESPIDVKNVNVGSSTNSHQQVDHENNSDTGLSSLHTSSDDGIYEVGTLVWNSDGGCESWS